MRAERWKEIEGLYQAALEHPPEKRAEFLLQACPDDPQLRGEVESLLAHKERLGSFLERPAIGAVAESMSQGFLVGQILGPYEVESLLGTGGMGRVYRARDTRLGRAVAIKLADKKFSDRFLTEARAVAALNHPHVCTFYDVGPNYLVMELVEGETLARCLRNASLPLRQITQYGIEIADALMAAHAQGIIHRDLKPGNIMVTKAGIKVLDFGLAKLPAVAVSATSEVSTATTSKQGHKTAAGLIVGTAAYMSPEQARGEELDARSDLFSFGVVLYEMATGRAPFQGKTIAAVLGAVMHGVPEPPSLLNPQLPPKLEEIIHKALEKDREVRYQHASELRADLRRLKRDMESSPPGIPVQPSPRRSFLPMAVAGFVVSIVGALIWLSRSPAPPRVTGTTQITRDGGRKCASYVTDGTRLYYALEPVYNLKFFQVSVNGGEPVPMPQLDGLCPVAISPDHSELMLQQLTASPFPLWVASTLGSRPRRLGDLSSAADPSWSPQGGQIVYTSGSDLRLARKDGTGSRKLVTVPGYPHAPCWSPDGRSIRFTVSQDTSDDREFPVWGNMLWEVSADGSRLHALFPEWTDHQQSYGKWTSDGKYFIFSALQTSSDIWAVRESRRLFEIGRRAPMRLTTGPAQVSHPIPSPDGKRIFFYGTLDRGELVRYDPKSSQWIPYLSGMPAMQLEYSRDGKWLTYVSYPEASLASDGSQQLQLTTPPLKAFNPRWSPDRTQIAFAGSLPRKSWRVYVVPAAGGAVQQLTNGEGGPRGDLDPGWSPDGASIVFSTGPTAGDQGNTDPRVRMMLWTLDVKTGRVSILPGSQGLWSPRWSPDGRYIAALGFPKWHLMLYRVATHQQTEIAGWFAGWPSWSRDSQFVYFRDDAAWYRVRIGARKPERVTKVENFRSAPSAPNFNWVGLAPDGSLISTRDVGSTEIYALDWEAP